MLENIEFLKFLSMEEQKNLLKSCEIKDYPADSVIFEYGEDTKDVYFIISGSVKSLNYGENGKVAYFRSRKAGDLLGYYSAITNAPRTANMVTLETTKLACLTQDKFMSLVCNNPKIAEYFLNLLGELLRNETLRLNSIITLSACERLAADIYKRQEDNILAIASRDEYASYLNMTRETLSRELNKFKKEKIISLKKNQIEVLNKEYLKEKFKK